MLDLLNEGNFKMFYIFTGQVMEIMAWKPRQRVAETMRDGGRVFSQDGQSKDVLSWDQRWGSIRVSSAISASSLLLREVDNTPTSPTQRLAWQWWAVGVAVGFASADLSARTLFMFGIHHFTAQACRDFPMMKQTVRDLQQPAACTALRSVHLAVYWLIRSVCGIYDFCKRLMVEPSLCPWGSWVTS